MDDEILSGDSSQPEEGADDELGRLEPEETEPDGLETEVEDTGEPGEAEATRPAARVPAAAPAQVAEARTEARETANAPVLIPDFTAEERAQLNDLMISDPVQATSIIQQRGFARESQLRQIGSQRRAQVARKYPDFYAVHAEGIDSALEQMQPAQRVMSNSGLYAAHHNIFEEAMATGGDLAGAYRRAADLMEGKKSSQAVPRTPPAVTPPSRRTPAPSVGATTGGGDRRSGGTVETHLKGIISGLTAEEIADARKGFRG